MGTALLSPAQVKPWVSVPGEGTRWLEALTWLGPELSSQQPCCSMLQPWRQCADCPLPLAVS